MGDVKQLPRPTSEPVEGVVKALESLLERARAGKVRAVVLCWDEGPPYDLSHHDFAGADDGNLAMLLFAIERVKFRLLHRVSVAAEDPD